MIPNIANFGDIDNHLRNIDKNNYLSSLRLSVICMDNITAVKNLKIGIMKDLHKHGLITQKQMELAIVRINRYGSEGLSSIAQKMQNA